MICIYTHICFLFSAITDNHLGHSVTVSLEPCPYINKLQTIPLMSVRTNQDGRRYEHLVNFDSYLLLTIIEASWSCLRVPLLMIHKLGV